MARFRAWPKNLSGPGGNASTQTPVCGIYGVVDFDGVRVPDSTTLRELTDRLAHRGPDGVGTFERPGVALGHRRLAILDRAHGAQPWVSDDGEVALVYNGELYNHAELRAELEARGHRFRTRCDTEVVLAAWREWGGEALERFEGMFAFVVVEWQQRRVFLARDRMGVKPLYYALDVEGGGTRLIFASEPTAIVGTPGFGFRADALGVSHYLSTLQVALGERTMIDGVRLLGAGRSLTLAPATARTAEPVTWWDVPVPAVGSAADPGEQQACEIVRAELTAAVERRLMADVPVGSFLSGGLDSTLLTHLAAGCSGRPIDAATVGIDEPGASEVEFAREAAHGRVHALTEVVAGAADFFEELPSTVRRRGLPVCTPNELPMAFMSRAVRDRFPVALTGEGADELLAGYGAIHRSPFDLERSRHLAAHGDRMDPERARAIRFALLSVYGVDSFEGPADHYLAPLQWIPMGEKQTLLTADVLEAVDGDLPLVEHYMELFAGVAHADPYDQLLYAHLKVNLAGLLLRVDSATMSAGLEARVPFTDHRLVEACMALPFHYKLRWSRPGAEQQAWTRTLPEIAAELDTTKYVLRRAWADEIPRSILERPKAAFPVPVSGWLTGAWRSWARERLLDSRAMADWVDRAELERTTERTDPRAGFRLWPLVNLALWLDANAA